MLRLSPSRSGIRTRTRSFNILIGNLSLPGETAPRAPLADVLTPGTVAGNPGDSVGSARENRRDPRHDVLVQSFDHVECPEVLDDL